MRKQNTSATLRAFAGFMACLALLGAPNEYGWSAGLGVRFADVILGNLQPGGVYNLRQMKNLPFVVINTTDDEFETVVEPYVPKPTETIEVKEGYENIPDPNWVRIVPNRFRLGPKGSAAADIILSIPNDESLVGKNFQVILWTHQVTPEGAVGFQINVGVLSRLRFSIGVPIPEVVEAERKAKKMVDLNIRMDPVSAQVYNLPLGPKIDLRKDRSVSATIVNAGSDKLKFKLSSVAVPTVIFPPAGYVYAPDQSWLSVKPDVITAKPYSIVPLNLVLSIPDKPENRGKSYMFVLKAEIQGVDLPLNMYTQIFVRTAGKAEETKPE